jgi:hypothetical protein
MPQKILGVLMLDTRFTRVVGDIGNPASFDYAVLHAVVPKATATRVIDDQAQGLLPAFIAAGQGLIAQGCTALTTTCGFLGLHQEALGKAFSVPFAASALLQISGLAAQMREGKHVTVLTINAAALTPAHLSACGAAPDTPVVGLPPQSHFRQAILEESVPLDVARCEADMLALADAALRAHPRTGAFVLECANMPPYARALRDRFGLPVADALTLCDRLMLGAWPENAHGLGISMQIARRHP